MQESLSNACRHSGSDRVLVLVYQKDSCLYMEIEDRGKGFDPKVKSKGHFGLEGIRERTRVFGGWVRIRSVPGKGTRIKAMLPLGEYSRGVPNLAPESESTAPEGGHRPESAPKFIGPCG